jgi:hypothetical protein
MICNWFSKLFSKKGKPQRRRVQVDIPIEQHTYRKANFDLPRNEPAVEDDKSTN